MEVPPMAVDVNGLIIIFLILIILNLHLRGREQKKSLVHPSTYNRLKQLHLFCFIPPSLPNKLKLLAYLSLGLQFFSDGFKVTVDDCVLKPVQRPPKGEREILFYEAVFDEAEERNEILQLRRFLPQYFGVVELDMTRYLKLENITGRFNVPCVMDIKIGKVTWDDGVDEQFKERRRKKWPLKQITGFSILGFMVYNHATSCYERYNREWCLKLATLEDTEKAFQQFFGCIEVKLTSVILEQLIAQLMEIKEWFTMQRVYRFIASSILIVYEGDTRQSLSIPQASQEKDTRPNSNVVHHQSLKNYQRELVPKKTLVETRMIDTAHVFASSVVDDNYLFGLENIISIIQKLQPNL